MQLVHVATFGCAVLGTLPSIAAAPLTANASLTSDYVWRGSSQTREQPAIQGGFRYGHDSGLYASAWASNVRFRPDHGASSEFDIALGWNGKPHRDWTLDAYYLRYQYPGSDIGLNWNEVNVTAAWRTHYWFSAGHSTNAMGSKSAGTHTESYTHGSLGAVWAFKPPFEIRLTLHATDAAAKRLFPGMAGARSEFALQASF